MAKLTLTPKPGRAPDSPSTFRPICLLDEAGKLFERIVASRLAEHVAQESPDLLENHGFRRGCSTIDAIERVKSSAQAALMEGGGAGVAGGVNKHCQRLQPWDRIRRALVKHRIPIYLRNTLQGLQPGVSKYTRLQYGINDPGVLELVAYLKPMVMSRRTGGLALTVWSARMTTFIKKSLTECYSARLVGTPQSIALGGWLVSASAPSGHLRIPGDLLHY